MDITKEQIKSMGEMTGIEYARQEAWDVSQASQALSFIAGLVQNEANEPEHTQLLSRIMESLLEFIRGEIKEMVDASLKGDNGYKSTTTAGNTYNITITNQTEPKEEKLNLSYAKSLGVVVPDMAVKYVARDQIKGYTFLWGNPKLTDVEYEYFTKDTNFWDEALGKSPRPLTWEHAQDKEFKAPVVIGSIEDFGDDDVGRWYIGRLERSHKYRKAIDALIEAGKLGTSSDSAPQYVVREKTGKSTWLKEWAWFASALTDTPAEPRMIGSLELLKSLGILLPDTPSADAWEWNQKRLKLLKLGVQI